MEVEAFAKGIEALAVCCGFGLACPINRNRAGQVVLFDPNMLMGSADLPRESTWTTAVPMRTMLEMPSGDLLTLELKHEVPISLHDVACDQAQCCGRRSRSLNGQNGNRCRHARHLPPDLSPRGFTSNPLLRDEKGIDFGLRYHGEPFSATRAFSYKEELNRTVSPQASQCLSGVVRVESGTEPIVRPL